MVVMQDICSGAVVVGRHDISVMIRETDADIFICLFFCRVLQDWVAKQGKRCVFTVLLHPGVSKLI